MDKSREDAVKARIMNHMNKDHKLALIDYIRFYGGIKKFPLDADVSMTDITLESMTIHYQFPSTKAEADIQIRLTEPMTGYEEARIVFVDMAKEAAQSQGYAPHKAKPFKISGFLTPLGLSLTAGMGILCLLGALPNSFINTHVPSSFLRSALIYRRHALFSLISIHVVEAVILFRSLKKFRVGCYDKAKWLFACLICGFDAAKQFKKAIPRH